MTFILAWKDKKSVFITGDSAVTRRGVSQKYVENIFTQNRLNTAFGESVKISNNQTIQESVLKIHNIRDEFILGYAGTGDVAIDVINELTSDEDLNRKNIASKIKQASIIFGASFQMVIGYFNKKSPILMSFNLYNDFKIRYHEKHAPIRLGNLRNDDLVKLISFELSGLFQSLSKNIDSDKKLLMACIFLQGVIVRARLLEKGVGGFFTGAYINKHGFYWQKDTAILKFDLKKDAKEESRNPNEIFANPQFIAMLNREGKLAVLSHHLNSNYIDVTVFQNYYNSIQLRKNYKEIEKDFKIWKSRYEKEIIQILLGFSFDYFVFLTTDLDALNKMTIIEKESLEKDQYFKISWRNNVPVLDISGNMIDEINPLNAEYVNQFHWMPIN